MSWEVFYFVCFLTGFLFSALTFFAGATHFHMPKGLHFHGMPHGHTGGHVTPKGGPVSWFNFGTVTAFLAWFGGTGFLLTRYSTLVAVAALAVSALSGVAGASVVFWFVFKFLMGHEQDLDPADYSMIGVLGRVTSTVNEGGVGEMLFSREGGRRCVPIRSDDNRRIAKDAEVVVIRFEKGIAYVKPWDELSGTTGSESWTAENQLRAGVQKGAGRESVN